GQATRWAEDFARRANLPASLLFAIQLFIEEAAANIIMYSGAGEVRQAITLELIGDGNDVFAVIEDGGRVFDATAVPPRRAPASIEDAPIGGLGIHLMRSFASEMRYERHHERNRLIFKFSPAEAA